VSFHLILSEVDTVAHKHAVNLGWTKLKTSNQSWYLAVCKSHSSEAMASSHMLPQGAPEVLVGEGDVAIGQIEHCFCMGWRSEL